MFYPASQSIETICCFGNCIPSFYLFYFQADTCVTFPPKFELNQLKAYSQVTLLSNTLAPSFPPFFYPFNTSVFVLCTLAFPSLRSDYWNYPLSLHTLCRIIAAFPLITERTCSWRKMMTTTVPNLMWGDYLRDIDLSGE